MYSKIRPQITTGCVILWKGKGLISWLIRRFSTFSHASIVVRLDSYGAFFDRIFLVEALEHGSTLRYLSKRIQEFSGEVYLFKPLGLDVEKMNCIARRALDDCALGIKYDYSSLFRNILGRVNTGAKKFFCSEEVDDILVSCGIQRKKKYRSKKAPRPGDIPEWFDGELLKIK